jgi:exonuclease SbcC
MRELNKQFDTELNRVNRELEEAERATSLIDEVPCSKISGLPEQCKLLSSAMESRGKINLLENRSDELEDEDYRGKNGLDNLGVRLQELREQKQSLSLPTEFFPDEWDSQKRSIGYDAGQHLQNKKEVEDLEKGNWESLIEELRLAESMIEEKQKALLSLKERSEDQCTKHLQTLSESMKQSDAKRKKWEEVKASLLTQQDLVSFQRHKEALSVTANAQKQESERRARTIGDIQFRQEMIKKLDAFKADAEVMESDLTFKLSSLENHKLLHRACSKDGIPALELDAAGPEVSRIANELLASTFGSRFQIAFETTRLTKDKKKQVETFDIRVYGAEGEKMVEDLSGGQEVWVEEALKDSIGIYNSEKSGHEFLTNFADEKDGALDPDNKQHFVEMSREAFRLGRRYYTFLITQTPEIWQQVQQRLHLHPEDGTIEQII